MKKYTKKEIMEIVSEAKKEVNKEVLKANDVDLTDENQFLSNLMTMKDMALISAFECTIQEKLEE